MQLGLFIFTLRCLKDLGNFFFSLRNLLRTNSILKIDPGLSSKLSSSEMGFGNLHLLWNLLT